MKSKKIIDDAKRSRTEKEGKVVEKTVKMTHRLTGEKINSMSVESETQKIQQT